MADEFDENSTSRWRVKDFSLGQTAPHVKPCFIVVSGSELGRLFQFDQPEITIGRSTDCGICISDEAVSRHHARVCHAPNNTVVIEDLGSTNGTFCNGVRVTKEILKDGDKILIGTTAILKFSYQDAVEIQFQERLFSSAVKDWLTGCYNKKYFEERLTSEYHYAMRHALPLSLILFDLDHFKQINDTHGHLVGDFVLKALSERIRSVLRREEFLSRYGGEEFIVLARATDAKGARVLAERFRETLSRAPFERENLRITVTASFGVAEYKQGRPVVPADLIKLADATMYRAKENGRNRVEVAPAP